MWKVTYKTLNNGSEYVLFKWFKTEGEARAFASTLDNVISIVKY